LIKFARELTVNEPRFQADERIPGRIQSFRNLR
jgi:hypothetical protein